jgi:hypothetical protein
MTTTTARSGRRAGPLGDPWARFACAAAFAAVLAAPLHAAPSPRDELLRFVPDDAGFCFVLQDLRGHTADLLDSPFAEQVRKSPIGSALSADVAVQQLTKVDKDLRAALGVGWEELRDDILGDAVVFVYRPGPPDKPDQEQGLFLVRARTPEAIANVVDTLNKAQKKDGALKELQDVKYQGVTYHRRVEAKQQTFYYLRGPVLLFTSQEDILRRAIDLDLKAAAGSDPWLVRRLRDVGADKAALVVWLNPRAFDAGLDEKMSKAGEPEASMLKRFRVYWQAIDGVALFADLDKDFRLSWAEMFQAEKLPAKAQRLLAEAGKPSDLWRAFPDDALAAFAGRTDFSLLFEVLSDFQPKDAAAAANSALGKDFFQDVFLPHVGPDWGFCLTAPAADDKDCLPRGVFVVRVPPGGEEAPADQALLSAVRTAALFAVLVNNQQHPDAPLRLKTLVVEKQEIYYLVGDKVFPAGLRPAFALKDGWLLFATSPEQIRSFAIAPAPGAPRDGPAPILRVSFKAWRAYLKDREEPLAVALAERRGIDKNAARDEIEGMIAALQFVDRLEITQTARPGVVIATLTLQTAQPLKK